MIAGVFLDAAEAVAPLLRAPPDAIPLTGNFCDNPGEPYGSPYPGG